MEGVDTKSSGLFLQSNLSIQSISIIASYATPVGKPNKDPSHLRERFTMWTLAPNNSFIMAGIIKNEKSP